MSLRLQDARMQRRGLGIVFDERTGGNRAESYKSDYSSKDRRDDLSRSRPRNRTRVGPKDWRTGAEFLRDGLFQVCLLQESELGLANVRFGDCGHACRRRRLPHVERDQSRHEHVPAARWEIAL